jgi:translation elongation factor EF-Tu-like GTPase
MKLIEFRALLRLIETEKGGRAGAIAPGIYRPRFRVNDVTTECQIVAIDKDALKPGEEGECTVRVIDMNGLSAILEPGMVFELLEGLRTVAIGRALNRANLID